MLVHFVRAVAVAGAVLAGVGPVAAGTVFDELRPAIFGTRGLLDGQGVVTIKAPYRPEDIRAVPFDVEAKFKDGRTVRSVTFVVDNNPSPVAARFTFGPGRDHVGLGIKFRLNQQSDVRAIVEASDGRLYMTSQLVKFPGGQAACSAPPQTPAHDIAANMGKMTLAEVSTGAAMSSATPRAQFRLAHPNHTGMVLDQITLLYTPLRMVQELHIKQGGETVFDMEGSIALNENPVIDFDYKRNGAGKMTVVAKDTDGAEFTSEFAVGAGS
ncbi:MAG: quinoprotein dehydrogenase-associated SoxYZ-like carrier [Hyphomicrobiaceae bacterium]